MVENGNENVTEEKKANSTDIIADQALHQILPSNCLPLTHQVAGHFFGKGRTKLGKFSAIKLLESLLKLRPVI